MAADTEMRDILIALRQQVQDGFNHLNAKLDAMERKHEGHEDRIRRLESESQYRGTYVPRFETVEKTVQKHEAHFQQLEGAGRGASLVANLGKVLVGAVISALGIMGFQLADAPPKAPSLKSQTTIERTVTLPTEK